MHASSSITSYAPSPIGERIVQQSSDLGLGRAGEVRRSRRAQMVLTVAIPILVVTYLTLGIIRCVAIVSDLEQHPLSIPSTTLRADQR